MSRLLLVTSTLGCLSALFACATGGVGGAGADELSNTGSAGSGGANGGGAGGDAGAGGTDVEVSAAGSGGGDGDPSSLTCAQATEGRTYVGCDFWPTVTFNPLYSEFDFAVVVANAGGQEATVEVVGPGNFSTTVTVEVGGLASIVLPWVEALKGPEFSRIDTTNGRVKESVRVDGGAYHLTSSVPLAAWQFNPLQYKKPVGEFSSCGTTFGNE